jgi:hypothetical protein
LLREELGYMLKGRNSAQSVAAPHYAFIYEPAPGITSKRLVEVVPAVTDPALLALLDEDDKKERSRKEWRKRFDTPPDARPSAN